MAWFARWVLEPGSTTDFGHPARRAAYQPLAGHPWGSMQAISTNMQDNAKAIADTNELESRVYYGGAQVASTCMNINHEYCSTPNLDQLEGWVGGCWMDCLDCSAKSINSSQPANTFLDRGVVGESRKFGWAIFWAFYQKIDRGTRCANSSWALHSLQAGRERFLWVRD